MKNIWIAGAAAFALSGSLLADMVTSSTGSFAACPTNWASSTPGWTNTPPPDLQGTPFWNNPSADDGSGASHSMNAGYLITDTGGFAGTTSVLGGDSISQDFTTSNGGDPTSFNFVKTATAYNIALLFADSSLNTGNAAHGSTFGYYVGNTYTALYTPTDTNSLSSEAAFDPTNPTGSYGFYATVCYAVGFCETYTTGNGNFGNVSGAAAWNHFALFQLASGSYVIGFEDSNAYAGEGLGDFNDIVVEMINPPAIPEPRTVATLGIGLAALLCSKGNALKRRFFVRAVSL